MKKIKSCCFTGHRPQNLPFGFNEDDDRCKRLKALLRKHIVDLIDNKGVTRFISGMALGVDVYAAQIVLKEKANHPDIILECVLPCETQSNHWRVDQQEVYYKILEYCDKVTLLQHAYTADCMNKRNRYIVDNSDYIIAVWNGKPSGTGNTVHYALQQGKKIITINPYDL